MRNIIIIFIFIAIILLLDRVIVPIEPESFHQDIITYPSNEIDFETCLISFLYLEDPIEVSGVITELELETLKIPAGYELEIKPFTVIDVGTTLASSDTESIKSPFQGSIMAITRNEESIIHFIDYEKVKIQAIVNLEQYQRIQPDKPFTFQLSSEKYEAYFEEVTLTSDYTYLLTFAINRLDTFIFKGQSVRLSQPTDKHLGYYVPNSCLPQPIAENRYRIKIYNPTSKNAVYEKEIIIGYRGKIFSEIISENINTYEQIIIEKD